MAHFIIPFDNRINALNNSVRHLFEKVQKMYNGVYYEIVVEPRTPELGQKQTFIVNLVDYEDDPQNERINALHIHPVIKEKLIRIDRLQENYRILTDAAKATLAQLKEDYSFPDYVFTVLKNKLGQNPEPVDLDEDSNDDEDTDSEYDTDSESDWYSESDLDISSDSGLYNSETDSQSELESDTESELDSGID